MSINDLKSKLGPGYGLRTNKFLIEVPIPNVDGAIINVLCRSTTIPQRSINTSEIWYRGRKFVTRAETNYENVWEITILDSSDMKMRKVFDAWMKQIDNSKPPSGGFLGTGPGVSNILSTVRSAANLVNNTKNFFKSTTNALNMAADFFTGIIDSGSKTSVPFQIDINVWQLTPDNNKVYGYKLQNAFPTVLGAIQYDTSSQNELVTYSITFSFSEFEPLEGRTATTRLLQAIGGDDLNNTINTVESLFD